MMHFKMLGIEGSGIAPSFPKICKCPGVFGVPGWALCSSASQVLELELRPRVVSLRSPSLQTPSW